MIRNNNPTPSPLRIARLIAGKTLAQVAEPISRTPMYVSRLERGGSAVVTPEIAEKIADVVGRTVHELFDETPEESAS